MARRYSDCISGCGGEDCVCCEIYVDHNSHSIPEEFDAYYDEVDDMRNEEDDDE